MRWKWTWCDSFSEIDRLYIHHLYPTQTLTVLNLSTNKIGPEGAHHIANAVKTNTVVQWFSSVNYNFHIIQTLMTLYLARNCIETEGARYLADALSSNSVRKYSYLSMSCFLDLCFMQTLTTLYLAWNGIGVKAGEYFADALRLNTVRLFFNFRELLHHRCST